MRYARADIAATVKTIALAPRFAAPAPTTAALRRVVFDAGRGAEPGLVDAALLLAELTSGPATTAEARRLLEALRKSEDLTDFEPPLDGHRIIGLLEMEPGPMVGRLLDALRQHRLDHGPYSADDAIALLPRMASRLGLSPPGRYSVEQ
jgi:hypothetical protein